MDRYDESKHVRSTESEAKDDAPAREGDVLGLGGSTVPKTPGDPSTEFDEESVARRKARAAGADEPEFRESNTRRTPGATGIDMGAGGTGTDLE